MAHNIDVYPLIKSCAVKRGPTGPQGKRGKPGKCESCTKCVYRLNLDPTSNPDPITGGLVITAAETQPLPAIFNMPLTSLPQNIDLANGFAFDPDNCITFNNAQGSNDTITVNQAGYYNISIACGFLSNVGSPAVDNFVSCQVLRNGVSAFAGPPITFAGTNFVDISASPIGPVYNLGAFINGSSNVHFLNSGDVISVVVYLQYDTAVITLTTNLSISLVCLC